MDLKILHTADWHIGQMFFEYDRSNEHQAFFIKLISILQENEIDVMLVCGDIFDVSNPSANSISVLYKFLVEVSVSCPDLQIVIIGGNHDSAARLEAPNPILKHFNINIIGNIDRDISGSINYEKLIIPLKNKNKEIKAWCLAIPFLRPGDYSTVKDSDSPYSDGISELYKEIYEIAALKQQNGQAIIAMGHLHTLNAEISENDKSERLIMGGLELVKPSAFNNNIAYTALGHIHKAQLVAGKQNIRYSGSPLPMSFSEINYHHKVIVFELDGNIANNISAIDIPRFIQIMRVPLTFKDLPEVLVELAQLPEIDTDAEKVNAPFLEVRIKLLEPEPSLRYKIEEALENKNVRLAKIDVKYQGSNGIDESELLSFNQLQELHPLKVFNKIYKSRFDSEIPETLSNLFNEVYDEVKSSEN